jgi:hypothetical protein
LAEVYTNPNPSVPPVRNEINLLRSQGPWVYKVPIRGIKTKIRHRSFAPKEFL